MFKSIKNVSLTFMTVHIIFSQVVNTRKCVDPFTYLECCPDIYEITEINNLKDKCQDYHLTHDTPYKTLKKCKKLYCLYDCIAAIASLVSIKNWMFLLIKTFLK